MKFFDNFKERLRRILLVFVIFSIGFAFGKHSIQSKTDSPALVKATAEISSSEEGLVRLYYMHAMFRCVTCNSIEEQAKALTDKEFSAELSDKKIEWVEVNFQEDRKLAEKFDVVASCVVVAVVKAGRIESFERLDQVWTLLEKPEEFNAYVRKAIDKALKKLKG